MEHGGITYTSLLIIILLATFVPVVVRKIKWLPIPIVVGEVIAGMIFGKSGFNVIESASWLEFLYTFGFAFLMFLSGLEIDFNLIKSANEGAKEKWQKNPMMGAVVIFIGTIGSAYMIASLLKSMNLIEDVILLSLILSTTSLGIVVPTLKENGLLNGHYGQVILLSALIADFATMLLVTIYISMKMSNDIYSVLLILVLFAAFFLFYRAGLKIKILGKNLIPDLSHATTQIKVRGSFALILIFIGLAQIAGIEIILGTFLAGLIVSLLDERDHSQLYLKLDAIGYGFFIPIFFIMVGANFDIHVVISNPKSIYLLPILLLAFYFVKIVPSLFLKTSFGIKETIAGGFLLSSRLSLIIATSAIGLKLGMISEELNGAVILIAIITCSLSPIIFNKLMPPNQIKSQNAVYMVGIKQKTMLLARRLKKDGVESVFITHNEDKYEKAISEGYRAYLGDNLDEEFLKSTGIQDADTVVIYKTSDDISTNICRICKEKFQTQNLLVLTNSQTNIMEENKYDAVVISPEFATVFMAENLILHPKTFSILFREGDDEEFVMDEIELANSEYFGMKIRKVELPGDCLILSIIRNGIKIIPHGNNILRQGDILIVAGEKKNLIETKMLIG